MCSPTCGCARSAAARRPLIVIGERTPGMLPPLAAGCGRSIRMEIGLIHPPVGLNIYIVNSIAPDVPVTKVMWGTIPYVICMMLAIVILCIFPEIATWLPDHLMAPVHK